MRGRKRAGWEDGDCAGRPALPGEAAVAAGGGGAAFAPLPPRVGRARWSGTSLRRGGHRPAPPQGDGASPGPGPAERREGWPAGRERRPPRTVGSVPRCQKRVPAARLGSPSRGSPRPRAWTQGAGLRARRFPGLAVGWHGVPGRRGPRGPLFQLHVARFSCQARGEGGGRSEGAAALTCQL